MFKSILISLACVTGVAHAAPSTLSASIAQAVVRDVRPESMLNWTIGDSLDYKLSGGLMNGTMHMFVREQNEQGFWLQQDLNLGFLGAHKVETLINKDNGQVIEMRMDGNKQDIPDTGEQEIIDSHKDTVTVPKGTFECLWIKVHNKKDNKDSEVWANPTLIPISGMLKTVAPGTLGTTTIELTDFKRN